MELKPFIGLVCICFGLLLQVSPIPGMIDGCRKGDIKSMTIGYFMAGITQACFWIGYGACLKDFFVYFPNITTASLFTIYLNMLIYVKKKFNYFYILNFMIIFELFVILSFLPVHVCDTSAAIISLIWQSTNAETIRLALKYKSPEYINPLLSFISLLSFFFSCFYSVLIKGYMMFIPNFYGLIINIINIYLYYWAKGFFSKQNCLVDILCKILKPENIQEEVNSNNIDIDYNNVDKINFLSKM